MNVICFGNSNTYGYDPCSYLGRRYDADSRWVDILAEKPVGQSATWGRTVGRLPQWPLTFLLIPTS